MMSGHGTVETAVEATRLGAFDFVEKPLSLAKLLRTVERALTRQAKRSREVAPQALMVPSEEQQMRSCARVQQIAANPSSVC